MYVQPAHQTPLPGVTPLGAVRAGLQPPVLPRHPGPAVDHAGTPAELQAGVLQGLLHHVVLHISAVFFADSKELLQGVHLILEDVEMVIHHGLPHLLPGHVLLAGVLEAHFDDD